MLKTDEEMENIKNEFLKSNNFEEVKEIDDADHLLIFHKDKKLIETKNIYDEDDYEENEKIMNKNNNKIKTCYVKNRNKKTKTKTKKQLIKIEKFKNMVVNIVSGLIVEVEDNKDSEILLVLYNDFSQWHLVKVKNPQSKVSRANKNECELFDLSFYWFKRVNEQKSIEETIDYIYKNLRKRFKFY